MNKPISIEVPAGPAARALDISQSTLRRMDDVLQPRRSAGGQRFYEVSRLEAAREQLARRAAK